jgi:putative chitinase
MLAHRSRGAAATLLLLLAATAISCADAACKSVYTVKSGDALSVIADNNGVSQSELLEANPDISDPDQISVGQKINIPPCTAGPSPGGGCGTYTVKSGDTISGIAESQGVTQDALLAANPSVTNPDAIQVGQVLNLPCGSNPGPAPTAPAPTAPVPTPGAPAGGVTITEAEFNGAITACGFDAQPDSKRVNMLASISELGGDAVVATKRELAMYMAQIIHESVGLSTISEIGGSSASYAPYYGRGYIQLTNRDNYETASQALFGDDRLVNNPDLVVQDDSVAWSVTSFYWKTRVHSLDGVAEGQFGATTRGINGGECTANPERAQARCNYYGKTLTAFGLSDSPDCSGCT